MQTGTVSRLRFCGRSWGLKIYFGWNIVRFWKSYTCSNKLDVQETNFSFTQFNRMRNHFFGCRIEVRWYSRSWSMGSDCSSSWKHDSEPYRTERPVVNKREACSPPRTIHKRKQSQRVINDLDNVDCIPSNVQSSHQDALWCVFEDIEAVIKMIIKGRSPTLRHVSKNHRVALDWLFDRINLDSKIQIKHIDTKNQLADILTKGNFTRDEWNHLLCFFNISHFSSINSLEAMSKRTQEESGEERVTAKSKPMMNLVSRCSERTPDVLPSIASESPGKSRHESQSPPSLQIEKYDRTERPVVHAHSSSYSEWNIDKTWSSQEWKYDELMEDRTGRPVVNAQHTDQFIFENEETNSYAQAESELSLKSRSFLHRVNDQVRKRQKHSSKDATKDSDKHSVIWGMFMSSTLQASVFLGKKYSDNWHSIKNTEDLTMKQMFDISEKLVSEQSDEIYRVKTIDWESSSWKYLPLVGDEEVVSLLHTTVYVFWDSVLCLGKMHENPLSNVAWEDRLKWFKSSSQYSTLITIDGEPMEFEWNIFPRIQHVAAQPQSPRVIVKIECNTRQIHRKDYLHVDVQRHLMGI